MNKFTKVKKALAVSLCGSMLFSGALKTKGMNCTCVYNSANSTNNCICSLEVLKETINNAVQKVVNAVVETGEVTIANELWQQTIYWVIGSFAAEVFSKILFSILEGIYDNCLKEKIESCCCCKKAKTVIDESINDFTKEKNIKKIIKEAINEAKKDGGQKYKDENIVRVKNLYNKTCYLLNVLFNKGVFGKITSELIKNLNSITNLELKKSRLLINGTKIFDQKSIEDLGKEVAVNLAQVIFNLNEKNSCLNKNLIECMDKEKIKIFEIYVDQAKDKNTKFQECFLQHVIDKMIRLFKVRPIDKDFDKDETTSSKLNKYGIFKVKNVFVDEKSIFDKEIGNKSFNKIKIGDD